MNALFEKFITGRDGRSRRRTCRRHRSVFAAALLLALVVVGMSVHHAYAAEGNVPKLIVEPKIDGTSGKYQVGDTEYDVSFEKWYLRTMVQFRTNDHCQVRFITMVGSELNKYKCAGFTVQIDNEDSFELKDEVAYTSFQNGADEVIDISDYNGECGGYFVLQEYRFGEEIKGAEKITVTPYVEPMKGVRLAGKSVDIPCKDLLPNTYGTVLPQKYNFLYSIGNGNAVTLDQLFIKMDGQYPDAIGIEVTDVPESSPVNAPAKAPLKAPLKAPAKSGSTDYTYDPYEDWKQSTLQFNTPGQVKKVTLKNGEDEVCSLTLKVVEGLNVTKENLNEVTSKKNIVLLGDIATESMAIGTDQVLYGNGFTVKDARETVTDEDAGFVTINGGTVENVRFVGNVDAKHTVTVTGNTTISRSYFSGGTSSAIHVDADADVRIKDSVIVGDVPVTCDEKSKVEIKSSQIGGGESWVTGQEENSNIELVDVEEVTATETDFKPQVSDIEPTVTFAAGVNNGAVELSFEKKTDETKAEWDPFILTVKKYGKELPYTVKVNDTPCEAGQTISLAEGKYTVTYSYTDTDRYGANGKLPDKEYTKEVTVHVTAVIRPNTFTTRFANTDKYLYRVGNGNAVTLGQLFQVDQTGTRGVVSNNVSIKAEAVEENSTVNGTVGNSNLAEGSTAKCVYTKDATDWTESTLKFTGEGPVKVTIREEGDLYTLAGEAYTLNLEVVNATNVTTYSELKNGNSVLLNDITMSSGGVYSLSNATLYGNGFTFDVREGLHKRENLANVSNNYVISINNAEIDNTKIIGKVYTNFGATETKDDWNFPCVLVNGGDCVIANSYISNCASPIRARNGANLLLKNTTLKGGSFCNLDIRGGVDLTVDGLTTINQVNGNDAADNGTVIVGLGVVFWYEGANGSETITVKGDGLTQYNYVASDQADHAISVAQTVYSEIFNIGSKFKKNDGSRTWVNTGILSLYTDVGEDNITQPNGYAWENVSMLGKSGHLCTQLAASFPETFSSAAPSYQSDAQYAVAPNYSFEYPTAAGKKNYLAKTEESKNYCYYDSTQGAVLIGFEKGDSFFFDPRILTVTKYGKSLTPVITMNGQTYTDSISFTEGGEYTINYTYTDPYNYGANGEENQSAEYTKTVNIIAVAADKTIEPATFDFNGKGYKQVTGTNSVTYVMPNIDDSAVDGLTYVKKTVGGKTVYYPVVCVRNGKTSTTTSINGSALSKSATNTALVMVFDGIVTITDNGKTYGSSNTNMADGKLSAVESGLKSALVWASANSYDTVPDVVDGKQCYKSASVQGVNRTQTGYDIEYIYRDDAGNEYHYFVKYVFPAKGNGTNDYYQKNATFTVTVSCGANGTVDNTTIKGVKYGTALTADGNKLKNGSTVIATATPNEKYAAVWSGLTNSVTKDTTVTLSFKKECTLTINCGEGGTVNTQTITGIAEGAKLTVDGNKLMVNGAVVATATPASGGIANWSIPNTTVSDDMTIDLTFVTPVTITISAGENGSVSPTSVKVAPGKKLTSSGASLLYDGVEIAKATASSGYNVGSWSGVPTAAITADTSVSISFSKQQSSCLVEGTMITMADGTQKRVADLRGDEELLVWNLETGTYDRAPIVFIDSDSAAVYTVMHVVFSDGTDVEVVSEHGFFDLDLGEYVYINEDTIEDYIGDRFVKEADVENNTWDIVTLTDIWTENVRTEVYSPVTFSHLCYFTNGMLSIPGGVSGIFNIFDVDVELMMYDSAKKEADLERYGELTLEDYDGMIPEVAYDAFNGAWLNVAIEKGLLTWVDIEHYAQRYAPLI